MTLTRIALPRPCHQNWDAMSPDDRGRFCEQCASPVFDLEIYTADEVEALLRRPDKVCVRARIDQLGEIKVRSDSKGRKLLAVIGAGLLASAQGVAAKPVHQGGMIEGTVTNGDNTTVIEAKSVDGKVFKTKAKRNGKFKFKRLPAGTYELSYTSFCANPWKGEKVIVEDGEIATTTTTELDQCIVIGVAELRGTHG